MCEYSHLNTIIGELLENDGKFCSSQGHQVKIWFKGEIYIYNYHCALAIVLI
jgi:hypothetical protein